MEIKDNNNTNNELDESILPTKHKMKKKEPLKGQELSSWKKEKLAVGVAATIVLGIFLVLMLCVILPLQLDFQKNISKQSLDILFSLF